MPYARRPLDRLVAYFIQQRTFLRLNTFLPFRNASPACTYQVLISKLAKRILVASREKILDQPPFYSQEIGFVIFQTRTRELLNIHLSAKMQILLRYEIYIREIDFSLMSFIPLFLFSCFSLFIQNSKTELRY